MRVGDSGKRYGLEQVLELSSENLFETYRAQEAGKLV